MLEVEKPADMKAHIGKQIGTSEWVTVDQPMIDKFAEATGDHQWIHVDVERAKREMPGGKTIAHGYLTLSLLPRLSHGDPAHSQALARHQLRVQQGALHRAGAGRRARAAAPDAEERGGHRGWRADDLRQPDRGRRFVASRAGGRDDGTGVRLGGAAPIEEPVHSRDETHLLEAGLLQDATRADIPGMGKRGDLGQPQV